MVLKYQSAIFQEFPINMPQRASTESEEAWFHKHLSGSGTLLAHMFLQGCGKMEMWAKSSCEDRDVDIQSSGISCTNIMHVPAATLRHIALCLWWCGPNSITPTWSLTSLTHGRCKGCSGNTESLPKCSSDITVTSYERLNITGNSIFCLRAYISQQQGKYQWSTRLALCEKNPLVTGGFPTQRVSIAVNVSVSESHHEPKTSLMSQRYLKIYGTWWRICVSHHFLFIGSHSVATRHHLDQESRVNSGPSQWNPSVVDKYIYEILFEK